MVCDFDSDSDEPGYTDSDESDEEGGLEPRGLGTPLNLTKDEHVILALQVPLERTINLVAIIITFSTSCC